MPVSVRSFAKINLGLAIGRRREDGFHELRTIYQTVALHDAMRIDVQKGTGIEIRCKDPGVPEGETNTCWRVAERVLKALKTRAKVVIAIDKRLPIQGGMGGASANAVATMLGMEKVLKQELAPRERHRIAAEVGSDLPLFLLGGLVLGVGRGEEVYPLPELPELPCVIATPEIGVSTPAAFQHWDDLMAGNIGKLTSSGTSDTMNEFSHRAFEWLSGLSLSGVPAKGRDRAETLLLDLVRTGIENDFERVVFPEHPELRDVKRVLEREGAKYASLSGSGSTVYGLFDNQAKAETAAGRLSAQGIPAQATTTLPRAEYWEQMFAK